MDAYAVLRQDVYGGKIIGDCVFWPNKAYAVDVNVTARLVLNVEITVCNGSLDGYDRTKYANVSQAQFSAIFHVFPTPEDAGKWLEKAGRV